MMKRKQKNDKIKLFIGLSILAFLFFIIFVSFYANRDNIYYMLNGKDVKNNQNPNADTRDHNTNQSNISNSNAEETGEPVEYLQNIVFIGDSITQGFDIYRDLITVDGEYIFKDAAIIASTGYGTRHAAADIKTNSVNLIYNEKPMKPEDIIFERTEKYVFICLGLNDLGKLDIDEYIKNYRMIIDNILNKSPNKTIVILSITPLVTGQQNGKLSNKTITNANNKLIELAKEYDIQFIDWAAAIKDKNGGLYESLSSDGYCHLKVEAYNRLAEYLMRHPAG